MALVRERIKTKKQEVGSVLLFVVVFFLGVPKNFPDFPTYIGTPKKNLGEKPNVKFFRVAS